jgi:glycosyltransferase involved in cell wall biosynthesis
MLEDRSRKLVQVSASLDSKLGGPVSVVVGLSKHLRKHFEHSLLIFGHSLMTEMDAIQEKTLFGNRYGLITNLGSKIFKSELKSADILLIHGYFLFSTMFALKFSTAPKVFIMPHGSLENYQAKRGLVRKRIFDFLFFKLLDGRQVTFLLGSNQEESSVRERFPKVKIEVVGLGISQNSEIPINNILEGKMINLYCMSRIATKKRIDLCLHALKILKNSEFEFHLSVYGSGDKALEKSLYGLAVNLGIQGIVDFKGHVKDFDRISAIMKSHIFLLPSENENFAVAVAESIQGLRPVVISRNVAMHEFVDRHKAGVTIENLSPEALANGILDVVENYQTYVNNCKISRDYLSWENVIEKWLIAIRNGVN